MRIWIYLGFGDWDLELKNPPFGGFLYRGSTRITGPSAVERDLRFATAGLEL